MHFNSSKRWENEDICTLLHFNLVKCILIGIGAHRSRLMHLYARKLYLCNVDEWSQTQASEFEKQKWVLYKARLRNELLTPLICIICKMRIIYECVQYKGRRSALWLRNYITLQFNFMNYSQNGLIHESKCTRF